MGQLSVVPSDCNVQQSFVSFLQNHVPTKSLDLSNATLVQVIYAHDAQKASMNGGHHRDYDLISWIMRLEEQADMTFQPHIVTAEFYNYAIRSMFEDGLMLSTINQRLSKLRNILKWSQKYGCIPSDTFEDFVKLKYNCDHAALTPDEISQIAHFRIDQYRDERGFLLRCDTVRTLERVRDMFVLQCNLGQRIGDMMLLCPDNFDEARTRYRVVQKKTGNIATVNLKEDTIDSRVTYQILRRYDFKNPLANHDESRFNKLLHRLLHMIGGDFLQLVTICTYKLMGEVHTLRKPLWQETASHTARRSHITIRVNAGVPVNRIRQCTGHKSLSSFEQYIRGDHYED